MTLTKKDFLINVSVGVVCVGFGFGLSKVLNDPTGERSHNYLSSTEPSSYQNELTVEDVHGGVEEVISITTNVLTTDEVGQSQIASPPGQQDRRKWLGTSGTYRYSDFFDELAYTDDQIATFMDLWIRNGLEWIEMEQDIPRVSESSSDEQKLNIQARRQTLRDEMENRFDNHVLDHFPNDYFRHKEYTASLPERREIKVLTHSFAVPLDNFTRDRLISLLYETGTAVDISRQRYFLDSADKLRIRNENFAKKDLRDIEFLVIARSYLTDDQYEILKQKMEIAKS